MSSNDSAIGMENDALDLITYERSVVYCRSCRHVLYLTSECVIREADYITFDINVSS